MAYGTKQILFTCIAALLLPINCGYNNAYKDIHDLQAAQEQSNRQLEAFNGRLDTVELQIATLTGAQNSLRALLSSLMGSSEYYEQAIELIQGQLIDLQVQMAVVSGYEHIDAIIDPCGDSPGAVDEVLLRMSDGQFLASFSSGHNTRFSVLPNGYYSTTDGTGCSFNIYNGMVSW